MLVSDVGVDPISDCTVGDDVSGLAIVGAMLFSTMSDEIIFADSPPSFTVFRRAPRDSKAS